MSTQTQKRLFTVAEYHKMAEVGILPERGVELINGEIINMSPIGTKHAAMVDKLLRLLAVVVPEDVVLRIQNPFLANDLSEPEPDICLVKFRPDYYESSLPQGQDILLIIEVADTTFTYDNKVKRALYAQSGVPEYWVLDLNKQQIHVYWEIFDQAYQKNKVVKSGEWIEVQMLSVQIETKKILG